jgi:PAS domain S-box-containing protein
MDSLPVAISYVDTGQCYKFNNTCYEQWFGQSRETLYGWRLKDVLGEEAYQEVKDKIHTVLSGEKVRFEALMPYKGAGLRDVDAIYIPHIDKQGEIAGFFSMVTDITDRKETERDLQDYAARLELLNSISTSINANLPLEEIVALAIKKVAAYYPLYRTAYSTVDPQGILRVIHSVEPEGLPQLTGSTADLSAATEYLEALRSKAPVVVGDVTKDDRFKPLADAMKNGGTCSVLDVPVNHSDDLVGLLCLDSPEPCQWREHDIITLKSIAEYLSVLIRDVFLRLERNRAERMLKEAHQITHLGHWEYDFSNDKLTWSDEIYRIFDTDPKSFGGDLQAFLDTVHPEDRHLVEHAYKELLAKRIPYEITHRIVRPNGQGAVYS